MNICPNCGARLPYGAEKCPRCGTAAADIPDNNAQITTVTVSLTPKEAKSGCFRMLSYPGAPEPMKVELPGNMHDGMELFIDDAPFYENYGELGQHTLRIVVKVKKARGTYAAAALLSFIAAAALIVMIVSFCQELNRGSVNVNGGAAGQLTGQSSTSTVIASAEPTVTPEPTPYMSAIQREAAELIPHFELRYYLNQLDDRLLENFCAMYKAVSSFETSCAFPRDLSKSELSNLTLLLSYECPELLQFSAATEITFYSDGSGNVISVQLPITMTKEQYDAQYKVCAGVAAAVAQKARSLSSEYEKELCAYNYISSNCFYNYDAPNAFSAYGALGDREAKCDGISLAMKWLCEEMGISCMVMAGNSADNPIGHAWNIIRIDGTYYDLDVTNDVNSADRDYDYYGAFNVSRYWIRSKYTENVSFAGFIILPGSEGMNMSYHALNGSYVTAGSEYEEKLFGQLNALESGEAAYLQFESWDDYSQFISNVNSVMSRWNGLAKGSFNYSLSHLDEFQVCRISVTYF